MITKIRKILGAPFIWVGIVLTVVGMLISRGIDATEQKVAELKKCN